MSVLYVIAGPNGIGKTTACYDLVPGNTPIINSDEIAKELLNTKLPAWNRQEYANQETIRLAEEQRNQKRTFAIETNLADKERYINSLSLLKYYFDQPDKLQLFDNSESLA